MSSVALRFRLIAATECGEEPLYRALCNIAVEEPQVLALLEAAQPEQRRPNLLLAAVQYLLLGGLRHPLADYYPSIGGSRELDDGLHRAFVGFCQTEHAALLKLIATHTTQTNEVGRCAVLWPILRLAAQRRGSDRIALLDFGCSAGLNLGVDRYVYDYGALRLSPGGADAQVRIDCRLVGTAAPAAGDGNTPRVVSRLGIDTEPSDVNDENSVRWLQACVWPHDTKRRQRFDAAVMQAREAGWRVEQHRDCTSAVEAWIDTAVPDALPVVFNSWVLTYFTPDARARHIKRMCELVQGHGLVWISAEAPDICVDEALVAPAQEVALEELGAGTLWTIMTQGESRPSSQIVARSHPHGKWMQWLA